MKIVESLKSSNTPEINLTAPIPKETEVKLIDLIKNFNQQFNFEKIAGSGLSELPKISHQDLILYQIKASNYHLQVELCSKAAESLVQTFRKVQSNQ